MHVRFGALASCRWLVSCALAMALSFSALLGVAAPAAQAAPAWRIDVVPNTAVSPGAGIDYLVEIRNVGDADADPSIAPIVFTGTLPAGLTVDSVDGGWDCSGVVAGERTFSCQQFGAVTTDATDFQRMVVHAVADPSAAGVLTAGFSVRGGGAPTVSTVAPVTVTNDPLSFGIAAFDAETTADPGGTPFTQAGGHPYAATTSIDFNVYRSPEPLKDDLTPVEAVKDINVDLPPGFFGDPNGIDRCTLADLGNANVINARPLCSPASQVGTTIVRANGTLGGHLIWGPLPVFNMVPPENAPARLGFNVAGTVVTLDVTVRSASDYGLTAHLRNIPQGLATAGASLTLWGVPADPSHDRERACPGQNAPWDTGPSCPSGAARTAFLRNPTSCPDPGAGLATSMQMDSWVHPGTFASRTIFSHWDPGYPLPPTDWGTPLGTTGCASVPFDPRLSVTPDTTTTAIPTGFSFDVTLPQSNDPSTIDQSDLRKAVVTLPLGVHLSPSASSGLAGCTPSQIGLHSDTAPSCPDGSKLGTVSIKTPALPDPLTGSIYLASPHDNPFDTLMAIYLVASGSGVTVKLPGEIDLDPFTGQVRTTIDDAPQLPFDDVRLVFKGGARAPLVNPDACGSYTTQAEFTGWSGAIVDTSSTYDIDSGCAGAKFTPGFAAGTDSSSAGSSSPFHVQITRNDDDAELGAVTVDMPKGLTGKIASATLCSQPDAAAGACPDSSKIGDVTVGAGAGANLFYITNGRAYITGPYKGAPFGLAIVVPAVAGPFDLGNVVVRSSIFVDKHDATLRVVSDPLPTILQGVTLGVRDVRIAIDKPGFILNPTSCSEKAIAGTITSTGGTSANVSDRFQAADCGSLRFKPRMALSVGGLGHTASGQTTPLTTRITMPRGDANLRFVRVTLPKTLNARLSVIGDACTRAQFENDVRKCDHARAGSASAVTPLLRDPLRGNVYFVKNGHGLPDLFIALRGQVSFDLIGQITVVNSRLLRTTFPTAPDVPIRSFTLHLIGDSSRDASIGTTANLCSKASRAQKAQLDYIGQNGKVFQIAQAMGVRGCPKPKKPRRKRGR